MKNYIVMRRGLYLIVEDGGGYLWTAEFSMAMRFYFEDAESYRIMIDEAEVVQC